MTSTSPRDPSVADSLREYGQGVAGGLLFSLPLLYTMEVWWTGFVAIASPWRLLLALGATFLMLLLYNRYAGLRHDATFREVVIDSVEEMGLGIVLASSVLWMLGRLQPDMSVREVLGTISIQASLAAIGVSVGTAQLGQSVQETNHGESALGQISIAACGAVIVAGNVAPTDEIVQIGIELPPLNLLVIVLFSLLLASSVLFGVRFRDQRRMVKTKESPPRLFDVTTTYATALTVAAAFLWFFGRFERVAPSVMLAQTVVLGLPAVLGASAGRFLIQ